MNYWQAIHAVLDNPGMVIGDDIDKDVEKIMEKYK